MRSLNSLVWRNLTAHKLRSILTLLAISLGVAMVLAASIVGQAANQSASVLSEEGPRVDLEVFSRDGAPFDDAVLDILRASPDVDQVSPVLRVEVRGVDPEIAELVLLGVDPEVYQALHEPELVGGAFLDESNTIVLPMAVAIDNGLNVGDQIVLQSGERRETLTVSGRLRLEQDITALDEANVAYVPLAVAQALRSTPGQIGRVEVVLHLSADPDQAKIDLAAQLDDELVIARAAGTGDNTFAAMTVQIGLALVGIIMLFAAAFVIMNAFAMSVTARTREIGSLRALGMTRRQVMVTVLAEAGLLGLAGASLGVPVGIGLAWGVTWARDLLDDVVLAVPWWGVAASVTMGLAVTLIGALQPARRASRVSPLTALRATTARAIPGWYERRGGRLGGILLLILLPGLTVASFVLEPDFLMGFAFLGVGIVGLLLGTVLLMPTLVPPVARLVRPVLVRRLGTVGWLAADNSARNKLRTALTAGALTIGLTAIIGTSTILTVSLKGGLDVYFGLLHEDGMIIPDIPALLASGDLTIENSMSIAGIKLDPALVEAVEALDVGTLVYYRFGPVPAELSPIAGAPGVFVEPEIFLPLGNFDFFEGDTESALEMMQRGRALLLMPIVADKLGVGVGDVVPVETPHKGVVEFTVAGVGGTGTNFTAFSAADGEAYFDISDPSWLGIVLPEDGRLDVDEMLAQVEAAIEPFENVIIFDMRDSGVGGLVEVVDRLQTMLNALLLLAVVVAGLGVVNTVVINVAERRREIALLRAVGATQRQVRQVVVTEAVTLGLMAALLATALSLAMLGLFVAVFLPNGATSVGMRVGWETARASLPPALRTLGITAALSAVFGPLVAGLAAYYPARQAAAMDVVEATRSERVALKTAGTRRPESRRHRRRMARSLAWTLAWRSLSQHRLRTILSALAVALGVAMIVAADVTSSGVSSALQASDNLFAEYFTDMAGVILSAVGFVILAAAGFLIFNAFAMAVTQRRRQIGALRSLGMTRRQVMRQLQTEALITGGLGTLLGLAAGPLFGYGMLAVARQFVEIGRGSVAVGSAALAVVMGLGITMLSVMIPARRATRISPLVALRQEIKVEKPGFSEKTWFLGPLIAIGLTIYLIVAPPGEWTGNNPPWEWIMTMLLALPWLAALMLMLPALIGGVGRFTLHVSRSASTAVRLMTDNLGRDRRRVTLTVLTFAVGLTVIVSMNGMLAFMNGVLLVEAAQGSLEQVSWFIYPFDRRSGLAQIQSFGGGAFAISPAVQEDVRQLAAGRARVSESYMATVPEISSPMPGFPSPISDLDSLTRPGLFTFTEGDWETARPIMESGCGLLLPSAVAARNGVGIGDTFAVTGKDGPVACTVAGIGHGGTAPMSIISVAAKDAFVDGPPASLTVWPLEGTDAVAFEAELRALADRHGDDAWVATPDDEVQAVIETSDQLESMMYSMLVLAIVAAALGMINTTVMSVAERRRELGLLRAVGATRRQTMVVVAGEAALIGLLGGLVGLVAGAGLTVIFCLAYGSIPFGLVDLNLWSGAWQSVQPALVSGLVGVAITPVVSAVTAWLSSRSLLRGSAIETMVPGRRLETIRHEPVRRAPVRSLNFLALRNMEQGRTRTILSALAVALGAAMTVAADLVNSALLNSLASSEDAQAFITGLLDQFGSILTLVGVGITLAAGFLIFNAFAMSVTQRRRQIGALRSLGMTRRQVMRLVIVEALITGGIGTLAGLVAGPLLGRGTMALVKVATGGLFTFGESSAVSFPSVLLALVLGVGITLLSALIPARRATHVSPLVALRASMAVRRSGILSYGRRAMAGGLVVLILFVYLVVAPPGEWVEPPWDVLLTSLFVLVWLGCLALILPVLIGGVGRWVCGPLTRLWKATGRLIADNVQRGRGRVTLTILTLVVGLTMIIGMTGFMHFSFNELMAPRIKGSGQLGAWAIAPFDISAGMSAYNDMEHIEISPDVIAEVRRAVQGRAAVIEWHFVIVPELSFFGSTYFSFVVEPHTARHVGDWLFTFTEGDWETAMPIMESGCGVLMMPLVASRNGVSVGDTFEVSGAEGPVECTVAGIGSTYVGASMISNVVAEEFGATKPITALVLPEPGVDRETLQADLAALVDRYPGTHLTELEGLINLQYQVLDSLPNMLNALLLLAIVSAALGVVNTMMMGVAERRHELGLLRAVGATRRQVTVAVAGEAALMGLVGGALGFVAGVGVIVILVVTYGGNAWGIPDLDLWPAAWRSVQPSLLNGLIGLIAAPFICAGAAWLPARSLLRGSAIETMEPERQEAVSPRRAAVAIWSWGSVRARFVLGTAVLMAVVLTGLIGVVVTHARTRIEEQTHDALRTMVAWNAGMIELSLPEDAKTLDFDMLATGETFDFDSDALLQFESLLDDMTANGLVDFTIADRDDVVLIGLDTRDIGTLVPELEMTDEPNVYSEREGGEWLMHATAPIRNVDGLLVGSVRLTADAREIQDFLDKLRNTLGAIGIVIVLTGVGVSWWLASPLAQATRELAARAVGVGRGEYLPYPHAPTLLSRFSLRTKLTAALVLILIVMVGLLELVAIPVERDHVEDTFKDAMVAGIEWIGQAASESFGIELTDLSPGQFTSFEDMLDMTQTLDLARLQELTDQMRSDDAAFVALVDEDGEIVISDQLGLIGEEAAVPAEAQIEEAVWRDEEIWVASTPLQRGQDGELIGALRMGIRRDRVDAFLDESRNLFRLTGLIAVLAGVLLAQAIGGAVTAPVSQLATDTRRVAAGDLDVQFHVDSKDELALLAQAYNQMVVGLREREWLRDMFGRFVSHEVAEALRTGQVRLEGENRVVSILFCDIRNFTARSERSTPEEMVALLNEYLPVVVDAAQTHEGTVNKFGGDSTLVIYGAPRRLQESAYQAVLTALEMRANLQALNARLAERGEDPIRIGVGINTGVALAGAVGPEERQEYTVIGDTVNLASRIEALNKEYPDHDILISGQTYDALGSRRREFEFADLGEVQIRGKVEPVRVWAVAGKT